MWEDVEPGDPAGRVGAPAVGSVGCEKLGLGRRRSAKVTVDPVGRGVVARKRAELRRVEREQGVCGRRGCRGPGSVDQEWWAGIPGWTFLVPWAGILHFFAFIPGFPVTLLN